MTKVYAPNKGYNGISAGVRFENGVAEVDRDNKGALAYFRRAGYSIGKEPARSTPAPDPFQPEVAARVMGGTPLRDAAVDPRPDDFLPPTNAGQAEPHGPLVVSPQIHADGPAGIKPGDVHVDEPEIQNRQETQLAERVLVEGMDKGEALGAFAPAPASAEASEGGAPPKKAKVDEWRAYAVAQGMDPDEAAEAKKDDLVARFGG